MRAKRERQRGVVGVSVSEWETESEPESSGEGDCERRLLYRYNRQTHNFAIGQSLNDLKLLRSFICIYLQVGSSPFRILGEILTTLKR